MFKPYQFWHQNKAMQKATLKSKSKSQARKNTQRETIDIELNPKWIIAAVLAIAMTAMVYQMPKEQWLPIEKIRLVGHFEQLDTASIEKQLQPYLGQGFFSVNIESIQSQLGQQPWVRSVSVRRVWPDRVDVSVVEKLAVARWDEEHLLSAQAVIFEQNSSKFEQLPKINGYSKQTVELLKRYREVQKKFDHLAIRVTEMIEDSKGSLSLELDSRLRVSLGASDNETKLKHLLEVYPQHIKPRIDHIQQIDFRYSNGFAIAWKKEYLEKIQRGSKNV